MKLINWLKQIVWKIKTNLSVKVAKIARARRIWKIRKQKFAEEKKLKKRLIKLYSVLIRKGSRNSLWYLILKIKPESVKDPSLAKILEGLRLTTIKRLLRRKDVAVEEIFRNMEELEKTLKKELILTLFWIRFFFSPNKEEIVDNHMLFCVILKGGFFGRKAWEELLFRIDVGLIRKTLLRRFLPQIIISQQIYRTRAWQEYKKLKPSLDDLEVLGSHREITDSLPEIVSIIREMRQEQEKQVRNETAALTQIHEILGKFAHEATDDEQQKK